MDKTKRLLVLGESKVGKTWLMQQLFRDVSASNRIQEKFLEDLQDQTTFASEKGARGNQMSGQSGQDQHLLASQSEKKLKSHIGCQIHTHLLNEEYELDPSDNSFYFVELYELSGQVSLSEVMTSVYSYQKSFDGLIVAFDLSNQKTIQKVAQQIQLGLQAVQHSGSHRNQLDFQGQFEASDVHSLLQKFPVLVVGCKRDQVESNRPQHLALNAQVLNQLKKLDKGNLIDYFESGLSVNRGVYKVPQEDLQMYLQKVFRDQLPLMQDKRSYGGPQFGADSYSESSDADGDGIDRKWRKNGGGQGVIRSVGSAFKSMLFSRTNQEKVKEELPQ